MKTAIRLLAAAATISVALPAAADDDRHRHKNKHDREYEREFQHKGGRHRHEYVVRHEYVYRDWRGGPPPWAPAHGYRRKAGQPQMAYVPPLDIGAGRCNRNGYGDVLGGALGAAAGGLLGAQVGDGRGQLAATAAGAVAGMLLGAHMGSGVDRADYYCMGQALEYAPERQPVVWAAGGGQYQIMPMRTYEMAGAYCREYQTVIAVGGRPQQGYGTACRQPDGSWKVMD